MDTKNTSVALSWDCLKLILDGSNKNSKWEDNSVWLTEHRLRDGLHISYIKKIHNAH